MSAFQDRRGFHVPIYASVGIIIVGLILIIFNWMVGACTFLLGCLLIIIFEAVSSPPPNNPGTFMRWSRVQGRSRPVILCLGDSITHGTTSASYTFDISFKLSKALGMQPPTLGATFSDPVWVINAGQGIITSYTTLYERLPKAMSCHPDYILLLIGTNDTVGSLKKRWANRYVSIWNLPEPPSVAGFERNLRGIVDYVRQASPSIQVGVCTIPPLGEDLNSNPNKRVREVNSVIERVVNEAGEKVSVVPVYEALERVLEKRRGRPFLSMEWFELMTAIVVPIKILLPFISWNALSSLFGMVVLTDGVHLNDRGADVLTDTVVEWLLKANIAKAIAVKSF